MLNYSLVPTYNGCALHSLGGGEPPLDLNVEVELILSTACRHLRITARFASLSYGLSSVQSNTTTYGTLTY